MPAGIDAVRVYTLSIYLFVLFMVYLNKICQN